MAEVTTGLVTIPDLDGVPANLRVTWIAWDSPFRATDLALGDRIVAINGAAVTRPTDPDELQRRLPKMVGQYMEAQAWDEASLGPGAPVRLHVRRRTYPAGWAELDMAAGLAESPQYRSADNRILLGPGGPDTMASDGFAGSWGGWYETMVNAIWRQLDIVNQTAAYSTRGAQYDQLTQQRAQVAYATQHYPGPWADALAMDFQAALAFCRGAAITLPPGALDFRRRGKELADQVRAEAEAGWAACQKGVAANTVAPFPALSPVRDDVGAVVGKYVVLPPLGNADWISDSGHGWFAAGTPSGGWYFLDAEAEPAQAMLMARDRFTRLVDPNVEARFEFVARVLAAPRLAVLGDRAYFGLQAEPVAALVGGDMFVDLTTRNGSQVNFAGEAGLVHTTPVLPSADAPPDVVLSTLVLAVKDGDIAQWRALFADWKIERRDDGRLIVHPQVPPPTDDIFERSRRSVAGRVLDARVAWVGDVEVVTDGTRFPGALRIEEVEVWLDHVGSFDGETRTFADVTVSPKWRLQRVDGGPWRISTAQDI